MMEGNVKVNLLEMLQKSSAKIAAEEEAKGAHTHDKCKDAHPDEDNKKEKTQKSSKE